MRPGGVLFMRPQIVKVASASLHSLLITIWPGLSYVWGKTPHFSRLVSHHAQLGPSHSAHPITHKSDAAFHFKGHHR